MNSAHLLSGLCTISSFPIRRAWHKFASQPRAGISNMSLSSLSTNLALVVSAYYSHLCQGTWGGLILKTRMNFSCTESQWNCHIERRKAKQIGWCGFLWTRLVYVQAVILVNHFMLCWQLSMMSSLEWAGPSTFHPVSQPRRAGSIWRRG